MTVVIDAHTGRSRSRAEVAAQAGAGEHVDEPLTS